MSFPKVGRFDKTPSVFKATSWLVTIVEILPRAPLLSITVFHTVGNHISCLPVCPICLCVFFWLSVCLPACLSLSSYNCGLVLLSSSPGFGGIKITTRSKVAHITYNITSLTSNQIFYLTEGHIQYQWSAQQNSCIAACYAERSNEGKAPCPREQQQWLCIKPGASWLEVHYHNHRSLLPIHHNFIIMDT